MFNSPNESTCYLWLERIPDEYLLTALEGSSQIINEANDTDEAASRRFLARICSIALGIYKEDLKEYAEGIPSNYSEEERIKLMKISELQTKIIHKVAETHKLAEELRTLLR